MRFVLHCHTHTHNRAQPGRVHIHYASAENHGNGAYWFPFLPRLVKHVEFGCWVMKLPSPWRMSGKCYSWRAAPQRARAVNTAPVCISLIHQRQRFLSQSTLFFPSHPALIRPLIHLLFISSVAQNDVKDLLWTVRESIWTLSNTIRYSASGCSRGSTLVAQLWQIRRDWALCFWMDLGAHGHAGICVCVCVLSSLIKIVGCNLSRKIEPMKYKYMVQHVPGTFQSTGSAVVWVCLCLFSPKLATLSQ